MATVGMSYLGSWWWCILTYPAVAGSLGQVVKMSGCWEQFQGLWISGRTGQWCLGGPWDHLSHCLEKVTGCWCEKEEHSWSLMESLSLEPTRSKKELWESGKIKTARPHEDGVPERKQTSKGHSQTFSWVSINTYGIKLSLGVVPHTYNPNIWNTETEAGGLSWFKASLGYTVSFRLACTRE